ncbi:MAG: hypothetical protein JO316_04600 [Abitibacteriaceae bacterium]|nr:hypothetical protein [Abditibacteriaceae bacterium]MBV9864606.1 hypothetical protein [Abditibacteriaceae bacterium]
MLVEKLLLTDVRPLAIISIAKHNYNHMPFKFGEGPIPQSPREYPKDYTPEEITKRKETGDQRYGERFEPFPQEIKKQEIKKSEEVLEDLSEETQER